MNNNNCCIQKVQITNVVVPVVVGGTMSLITPFTFANAQSCQKFLLVFGANIPSQVIIGSVVVVAVGVPTALFVEMPCCPDNLMSDQLVGVGSLLVSYAKNSARLRVEQAFTNKGCPMCLRKTAFYQTVITAPSPLAAKKKAVIEPNIEVK